MPTLQATTGKLRSAVRVFIRHPQAEDADELMEQNRGSAALHHGWVTPPTTPAAFDSYLLRCQAQDFAGFLICRTADGAIVGVANLSQIFRGPFQNAYLGYYALAAYAGQGYMREGLALVLDYAFGALKLHRLEANIQPSNTASLKLVERLGFRMEGYSPRYLKIQGRWRDHTRWAILAEEWRSLRRRQPPRA